MRYDGNTFFVFDQILSPSNAPYWTDTPKVNSSYSEKEAGQASIFMGFCCFLYIGRLAEKLQFNNGDRFRHLSNGIYFDITQK